MSPFSMLGASLKLRDPNATPDRSLAKALAQRTGYSDTHPCLADRLKAIVGRALCPRGDRNQRRESLLGTTVG